MVDNEMVKSSKNVDVEDDVADEEENLSVVLTALGIADNTSDKKKMMTMAKVFTKTVNLNGGLKDELVMIKEQLEKTAQTKDAMKKLVDALKSQSEMATKQWELKLQEESRKRLDVCTEFENQLSTLRKLIETHIGQNKELSTENSAISIQMKELFQCCDAYSKKITEKDLMIQLLEAKLAKSNVEKAELKSEFTQEKLSLQKDLLDSAEQSQYLSKNVGLLQEQIEVSQANYKELEKGIGDSGANFKHFRNQIEKMSKNLKAVELDTAEWKRKFELSNEQVKKMNDSSLEREMELSQVKKKLSAMENLNRTLLAERNNNN